MGLEREIEVEKMKEDKMTKEEREGYLKAIFDDRDILYDIIDSFDDERHNKVRLFVMGLLTDNEICEKYNSHFEPDIDPRYPEP